MAPVQVITRSAVPRTDSRSPRATARAAYSSASRSALTTDRFTTTISAAPSRETVAVASEAIEPAPTTTTRLPCTWPDGSPGSASAASTRDGGARSMSVSARARLPTRSACWNSEFSAGPTVPSSCPIRSAARVWPRIWPSPTTIESSPEATWNRCATAPSS